MNTCPTCGRTTQQKTTTEEEYVVVVKVGIGHRKVKKSDWGDRVFIPRGVEYKTEIRDGITHYIIPQRTQ